MKKIEEIMTQRRSPRVFDDKYEIPETDFNNLLEAMRMSPSSFGIINQRLLVIKDKNKRNELASFFYNQQNYLTASAFIIVLGSSYKHLQQDVEDFLSTKFENDLENETRAMFKKNIHSVLFSGRMTDHQLDHYCEKQTFITVGVATVAAAELNIDSCIMEGFNKIGLQQELIKQGLINDYEVPYITIALGKSAKVSGEKIRRSKEEFIKII